MPTIDEIRKFSDEIATICHVKNMKYMEAILWHCEQTGFEIELAATLLTPYLKSRIAEEAESVNLMKKTNRLYADND